METGPKQKVQTKLSWPAGVRSPGLAERPQNTGASGETAAPLVPVPVGEPAPIVEALSPGMSPEQPIRWNFCDPQKVKRAAHPVRPPRAPAAAPPAEPPASGGSNNKQVSAVLHLLNRGKKRRQRLAGPRLALLM